MTKGNGNETVTVTTALTADDCFYSAYKQVKNTTKDMIAKAIMIYGVVGSSVLAVIIMVPTWFMAMSGAVINGTPYTPFAVIMTFVEFMSWFIVPFSAYGLFKTIPQRKVEVVGYSEAAFLWDTV